MGSGGKIVHLRNWRPSAEDSAESHLGLGQYSLLIPVAYTLACAAALIAVLELAEGVWMAIGLTVVAFLAGHIPEAFVVCRYSTYREEWELANMGDVHRDKAPDVGRLGWKLTTRRHSAPTLAAVS